MRNEPTLAAREQNLKKSVKTKVLAHFQRKRRTRVSVEKMFQILSEVAPFPSGNLKLSHCLFSRKNNEHFDERFEVF